MFSLVLSTMLFIFGIISGIYFSIIWGFIGGIIQVVNNMEPAVASEIVWGLTRVFILGPLFGVFSFLLCFFIATLIIDK